MSEQTMPATLAFTRSLSRQSWLVQAIAIIAGSAFIAAAAQIEVPMFPVPMTMQTFAVLLVGALYGGRLGALTLLAYLVEGAAGIPVFAGAGNLATVIAKPATAGYLVGFLAAAYVVGTLMERGLGRSLLGAALAFIAGNIVIYIFGLAWLGNMIGFDQAVTYGFIPFILGDILKLALALVVREGIGRVNFG